MLSLKAPRKQTTKLLLLHFQKYFSSNRVMLKIKDQKANTVDPDETAHYEPSHLDLQFLQIQLLLCLAL